MDLNRREVEVEYGRHVVVFNVVLNVVTFSDPIDLDNKDYSAIAAANNLKNRKRLTALLLKPKRGRVWGYLTRFDSTLLKLHLLTHIENFEFPEAFGRFLILGDLRLSEEYGDCNKYFIRRIEERCPHCSMKMGCERTLAVACFHTCCVQCGINIVQKAADEDVSTKCKECNVCTSFLALTEGGFGQQNGISRWTWNLVIEDDESDVDSGVEDHGDIE